MARGWHYAKLSLSNAPRLSFSGMCILLFLFLSLRRFCLFVFFFCSHWSLVDVPLIFFCPADRHFSSYEGHMERRTGKIRGVFSRMHRALDCWMLARAPASPAQGLHHHGPRYFIFSYFCTMCGLENLGLVDQNWLERNCSGFLLKTLVVRRRQHSESIEVALDME